MKAFTVFEVWATPRDPYTGNKKDPIRLKVYASEPSAIKYKKEWEFDYGENCDRRSDTCGKSPCWIDFEPRVEIKEVEVEE